MKTQEEVNNGFLERHTPEGQVIRSELSGIWNNGYYHGYETAERKAKDKYEVDTNMQYNLGYQHGYDNGKDVAYKELSGWTAEEGKAKLDESYQLCHDRGYDKGYATGLEEAQDQNYQNGYDKGADDGRYELWQAIKKLYLLPCDGGFSINDNWEIFGGYVNFSDILRNYTPEEVIEKVKAYRKKTEQPVPTNRDKFEKLLGYKLLGKDLSFVDEDGKIHQLDLDEPYKEPEHED